MSVITALLISDLFVRKILGCLIKSIALKGTVHPKMKILSFTHPQVDPNLYECVCSEHKGRYSEE